MNVLVTGHAGFIGYHVVKRLQEREDVAVTGVDALREYYSPDLKLDRLSDLGFDHSHKPIAHHGEHESYIMDVSDTEALAEIMVYRKITHVIHLAAQAGVRHSIENPLIYISDNIEAFASVLEVCNALSVSHLIYASSSSVYGGATSVPFKVSDRVDRPVSTYAATKKCNELQAHTYSHLFQLPCTGLRFFTCYGPWTRPDMALHLFVDAIANERPIEVFNHGHMRRDFTYVGDVARMVEQLIDKVPSEDTPYRLLNIGAGRSVELGDYVKAIEKAMGTSAEIIYRDLQAGDMVETYADISETIELIGSQQTVSLQQGVDNFVKWYKAYYDK